jgi:LuxR family transcriptional regulator of spore coat protein
LNLEILTKREKEIFDLLVLNKTTFEIAKLLNITEKTVRNHISNVIGKLGVSSRTQAIIELIRYNVIKIEK